MNNSDFNISQDKLNNMLKLASQKLGTTPEKLKSQLQNGNFDSLKTNSNISSILNDPKRIQELMKNPQVQNLIKNLNNKK